MNDIVAPIPMPRPEHLYDKVSVQLTTVHNWVELVYQAFGQELPTAAKEVAILGVREASIAGTGTASETGGTELEDLAAAGSTDQVSYTQSTRTGSLTDAPTTYDDLLFVVYTDSDAAHTQHVDVYRCSIDPTRPDSASVKLPLLLEGKLYKGTPGSHGTYPGAKSCLHLYTSSKEHILLAREATRSTRIFKELESTDIDNGNFVREEDNGSIHMHFSDSKSDIVGGWSTGCTVLKHKITSDRYIHFKDTFNAAPNQRKVPYLVVSSQYVRSYGEWVKEVDRTPGTCPAPGTVIMKDQLVSPTGVTGKYLPSIMTKEFADAVLAEAETLAPPDFVGPLLETPATRAANLRASLERALFTVSTGPQSFSLP